MRNNFVNLAFLNLSLLNFSFLKKAGLTALLSLLLLNCNNLKDLAKKTIAEPEITYKSLSVGKMSSDGIELIPVFEVKNKNAFSIPIDTINYELSLKELTMLNGAINNIGTLAGNSSKDIPISFLLNKEVFAAFKELLINNEKLDFTIKGQAKVMGFAIPFEKSATFYRPQISIGKLDIGQANFQQIQGTVSIKINNPNAFTLPLDKFGYQVATDGKSIIKGEILSTELKQGLNEIQIPLTIKPSELFSSVFSLIKNPNLPLNFQIDSPLNSIQDNQSLKLTDFISL